MLKGLKKSRFQIVLPIILSWNLGSVRYVGIGNGNEYFVSIPIS